MHKPKQLKKLQWHSKDLQAAYVKHYNMSGGKQYEVAVRSAKNPTESHITRVFFTPNGDIETGCDCEWAAHGGICCSHGMAAIRKLAELKGKDVSFWDSQAEAEKQHRKAFKVTAYRTEGEPEVAVWITLRKK